MQETFKPARLSVSQSMFWILFRPERIAYCEGPIVLRGSRKIQVSDGEHMLLPDGMRPEPVFTYSALYNTTRFHC